METSTESSRLVNLVIRSVYMPSESLSLSVDPQMLISALKCRLCAEFPSNPSVSSQKLIFGGKICSDHESLEEIVTLIQSSHQKGGGDCNNIVEPLVFHLLLSSTGIGQDKNDKTKMSTLLPALTPTLNGEATEAQHSPRSSISGTTLLAPDPPTYSPQPSQSIFNQAPAMMTQQEQTLFGQSVLMQQQAMVLHQIQYLQYLQMQQRHQQATRSAQVQDQPFGAQIVPPYGNLYEMMQPQMFREQMRPRDAQGVPHTRVYDYVSAEAAVLERQNRWMLVEMAHEVFLLLDFRMALKMAFMLLIIGQDLPTDRILMLGLLSFISFLHITGIFAKIYEVYKRHRRINAGTAQNAPPDSDAPGAAAAVGAAILSRCGLLSRVLRISADRGYVQDIKYFVVGLLLSLIPAWRAQPIDGVDPVRGDAMPNDMPIQEI
ncbi:unnamed protein product [Peronospora belbahrii]|uniref:Ubiquitin-like domain-containing protein n=1 Tax=Peronospora belbahrii TaxID=622444 RepID=A0AAU9KYH0_9STRA|nr:unnamed protein product [Peronospora belbahrii]CAH0515720.1 unnamed protein product [Peronospora belbahrii]